MEIHSRTAGGGWQWIVAAFRIFRKSPLIWIALAIIFVALQLLSTRLPPFGALLMSLLSPIFYAGFMAGAREVEKGGELELLHLFAGFKKNTAQLVSIGGIYLVGLIGIFGITFALSGDAIATKLAQFQELEKQATPDPQVAMQLFVDLVWLGLPALLLAAPLFMAYWFAPALVYFDDRNALQAMKLSFNASLKNILPFLVYVLILGALAFIAMIPAFLGFLVLIPLVIITLYTSYNDVFEGEIKPAAVNT